MSYKVFSKVISLILVCIMLFSFPVFSQMRITSFGADKTQNSFLNDVTGFSVLSGSTTTIKLGWNKVENADGYNIYKFVPQKNDFILVVSLKDVKSYRIENLLKGTFYTFYIKAYKLIGEQTVYSANYSKITCQTRCAAPVIKSLTSEKKGCATISWSIVPNASYYQIMYSYDNNNWRSGGLTDDNQITIKNLKSGKKVYFKVSAYNKFEQVGSFSSRKTVVVRKTNHSDYYVSGYSAKSITTYFNEVALNSEYPNGSKADHLVRKWTKEIRYCLSGSYTKDDIQTVKGFFNFFNNIEGSPKSKRVYDKSQANLVIYFCKRSTFNKKMADALGDDADSSVGGVTFWYDSKYNITEEMICICTEVSGQERVSVIMEELYNGMGCIQDTIKREDSIIYQYSNTNYALSAVDEAILKIMYNKNMKTGMNKTKCKAVIEKLYY